MKTPSDATDSLVYKSNNLKVAKVDSNGKVTAVGLGSTTITVSTKDGSISTDCSVTVQVPPTEITLNIKNASIERFHSVQLKATIKPSNAANKTIKWSSNAPTIASVDSNGKVSALRTGTAKITAKTEDGSCSATCAVTVIADTTPPKIVSISPKKNQKDVALNQDIIVKFNETVELLRHSGVQLTDSKGNQAEAENIAEDNELIIHPKENLQPGEKYTLIILKGAVEDLAEYPFKSDYKTYFTTVK